MRTSLTGLAVLFLLGCGDDGPNPDPGPSPLDVRISATEVFAGDEVFLRGDWYRDSTRVYVLSLDGAAVSPRRANDSTVGISVPSTAIGSLALRETVEGSEIDRATLTAYGYVRQATVPGSFWGLFTPSYGAAEPYVISGDSAGISVILPATDNVITYAGLGYVDIGAVIGRGVGITSDPDRFIVPQVNAPFMYWVLAPDTTRGPGFLYLGNFVSEMSPGMVVISGSNTLQVYQYDSVTQSSVAAPHFEYWLSAFRHILSPAGNRFTLTGSEDPVSPIGTPVFNTQTGTPAFRVASMGTVFDAAFSGEGNRLYLAGSGKVMAVDALTGDSLATLALGSGVTVRALTVDPAAPVIYLMATETVSGPQDTKVVIQVLDAATLTVRSVVESPSNNQCGYCALGRNSLLQVNRVTSEVTALFGFPDHALVLHFSLPPASALGAGAGVP